MYFDITFELVGFWFFDRLPVMIFPREQSVI